jgi:hypothetical protein
VTAKIVEIPAGEEDDRPMTDHDINGGSQLVTEM